MERAGISFSQLRRWAVPLLDAVLPPLCLSCRTVVGRQGQLCAACWQAISFLGPPCCAACGLPFPFDEGGNALCAACSRGLPAFDRARAVMVYDDASRPLLLGFKHGDRTEGAPAFGAWLARAGAELLADAELIVPVPLHRWRLLRRRFNQSALLALALGRKSGVPVAPDLLRRARPTPSQAGLDAGERRRNVRNAFAVAPPHRGRVAGRRVLLVDDVYTTGEKDAAYDHYLMFDVSEPYVVIYLERNNFRQGAAPGRRGPRRRADPGAGCPAGRVRTYWGRVRPLG